MLNYITKAKINAIKCLEKCIHYITFTSFRVKKKL